MSCVAKIFQKKLIPTIFKSVWYKEQNLAENASNSIFMTDIWTSVSDHPFISVTGHCLNINFKPSNVVL